MSDTKERGRDDDMAIDKLLVAMGHRPKPCALAAPAQSRTPDKRKTGLPKQKAGLAVPHLRVLDNANKDYNPDFTLDMELDDMFKAIDLLLARHLRGDKSAKGDLQMLTSAIRLKILLFRTEADMQNQGNE
jgi:hypothetical protein